MRTEDRLNLSVTGYANDMLNVSYVAGRLDRDANTPDLLYLQQTPVIAQRMPILCSSGTSRGFDSGSYVSVFARARGRTILDSNGVPVQSGLILNALNIRYVNAHEVDPNVMQERLMHYLKVVPKDAEIDTTIKALDIDTPDELVNMGTVDEPFALKKKENKLIRNGNHVRIAGVIGFMEYREDKSQPNSNRVQLYLQQSGLLEDAIPIRIYGGQAALVANTYLPGHAIYVSGEVSVDVKKNKETGALAITPFVKTHSVEVAQLKHIRISPYPKWAVDIYEESKTKMGLAKRMSYIEHKATPRDMTKD